MGEECGGYVFPKCVRRTAKRRTGLCDVVLEEPGIGEQHADPKLVLAGQRRRAKRLREMLGGLDSLSPLERRLGARDRRVQGDADHERQYTRRTRAFRGFGECARAG